MKYGQKMGLETWEKTGAEAQVRQLHKAGLNKGLMYSGAGGSAPTTQTPSGTTQRGTPMGLDLSKGVDAVRQQAEIDNIKADTEKKKEETENISGGVRENLAMGNEKLAAEITNMGLDAQYKEYENKLQAIRTNVAKETEDDAIYSIKSASTKLVQEARQSMVKTGIDEATQEEIIRQINRQSIEQGLRISIAKQTGANLRMQGEEIGMRMSEISTKIEKIEWDMQYGEKEQALKERDIVVKELANEFLHGDEAKALRLFNAQKEVMNWLGQTKTVPYGGKAKAGTSDAGKSKSPNGREFKRQMRMGKK